MTIRVPNDRGVAGMLTLALRDRAAGGTVLACATASSASRASDPAYGRYLLHEVRVNETSEHAEFGPCRLVFEPESGDALAAEARGVLTLELHGGELGSGGRLRRTAGGVRVANDALIRIARLVSGGEPVSLDIIPETLPWWSLIARWRRRLAPEYVESDASRDDDGRTRDSSSSSSGSSGSRRDDPGWTGGGGSYGGAGSSGSWNEGAVTAAAAGAVAAAAATAATAATAGRDGVTESDAPGTTTY